MSEGQAKSLLLATKLGLHKVTGDTFVDASGDGDLCHFADFGYEVAGSLSPAQTLTTTFKMINVDLVARKMITEAVLGERMIQAPQEGYELPRRDGSDHITLIGGMSATVMTRLDSTMTDETGNLHSVLEPDRFTAAEIAGRRQAVEYSRFLVDKVEGYSNASLVSMSTQIGLRETRRVYGDYRLTRENVLEARQFDDQIALCAAPIEDHHSGDGTDWSYLPDGSAVGIPLRSVIVRDAQNVLVAGRCLSATHDAHATVRSMTQTMAMGQTAGTTAALAALGASGSVRSVSPSVVRDRLNKDGAILSLDSKRE